MVCSPRIKRLLSASCAVMLLCGMGASDLNAAWARRHTASATQTSVLGIVGVQLNPDGSGISVQANRAFTGNETRNFSVLKLPSPYRIVLDIPNARLNTPQTVFPINQNGIERVELVDTQSPFYSSVRAIVYVNDNTTLARLAPDFEGNALRLLGATPIAMTPEQIAATNFVKKPMGKQAQPLPPLARPVGAIQPPTPSMVAKPLEQEPSGPRPAQTVLGTPVASGTAIVEDVYFRDNKLFIKSANGTELHVKNRFQLTAPNRLVLEIGNAVLRDRSLLNPISTKLDDIRLIRMGQFDENTVRVVIEGQNPDQCEAIYYGGEKNLLAVTPYASTSITKLSANTRLGEVQSIDLKKEGNNTVLRITASTPIVHRFLKKDDRVVLDLLNEAAHPTNIGFDPRQYPEIEKMRLEPLTEGQPNSKLSIVLARAGSRVVPTISDDGKVLELQITSDEMATVATSAALQNLANLGPAGKAPFPARIVVDAGHGGKDNGAMRSGVNEKDLNLSLALMVRDALEAKGFKVYMTRSTDVFLPLPQITAITNQIHPDLFISIHHNASVNSALNGIETYYYTPQSVGLARRVHAREINNVGSRDGGVKKAMFYVIHHTSVPAILCEVGYVSNPSELTDLQGFDRKSKTARSIADGVVDYLRTRVSAKAR